MSTVLADLFRHNVWANLKVIDTCAGLTDEQLDLTVTVRGQPTTVREALLRGLAHTSYHVGQMITVGRELRGDQWRWLSIPPGGSAEYNRNPKIEKGPPKVRRLE